MVQINEERTKRLQLRLPRNELVAIEEFRFRARMPTRPMRGRGRCPAALPAHLIYAEADGE
jgi:hypothetical protein